MTYQDSWLDIPMDEEDVRVPNPHATKQLFTLTVEAEDMYDEGPWDLSQIITAIESCESGLKVLDVTELPSESSDPLRPVSQGGIGNKNGEFGIAPAYERPPRRPRT